MKTIKELNEKWYWRTIKVIYIFFVILAIFISFAFPIWAIFFEEPEEFLAKDFEKKYEKDWKTYIEKQQYLKEFREKNPFLSWYSDEEILAKAKEKRPDLVIFKQKIELDYMKAIPFCIIWIIFYLIILWGFLFLIRWIAYYIILWKFNPPKN